MLYCKMEGIFLRLKKQYIKNFHIWLISALFCIKLYFVYALISIVIYEYYFSNKGSVAYASSL